MSAQFFPVKVLCLHGYRQDGNVFRQKIGSFRKAFKNLEFEYLDSPNEDAAADVENSSEPVRSWFNHEGLRYAYNRDATPLGSDKAINAIDERIRAGSFDLILGFSQGACMTALYLAAKPDNGLKGAIFVAGYPSYSKEHADLIQTKISTPALFITGTNDEIIPTADTYKLQSQFLHSTVITHDGRHGFPTASKIKPGVLEFLKTYVYTN